MADDELLNVFLELLLKLAGEVFVHMCVYVFVPTETALQLSPKQSLHFKLNTAVILLKSHQPLGVKCLISEINERSPPSH